MKLFLTVIMQMYALFCFV